MTKRKQTPAQKPVQTYSQALAWVKKHVTPAQLKDDGHATTRAAVLWFAAFRQAESGVFEDLSRRDFCDLLVSGWPKLTPAGVDEEWQAEREDCERTDDPYDLTEELGDFFTDRGPQQVLDEE